MDDGICQGSENGLHIDHSDDVLEGADTPWYNSIFAVYYLSTGC